MNYTTIVLVQKVYLISGRQKKSTMPQSMMYKEIEIFYQSKDLEHILQPP